MVLKTAKQDVIDIKGHVALSVEAFQVHVCVAKSGSAIAVENWDTTGAYRCATLLWKR